VELVDKAEFVYVHSLYYSRGLLPLYDRNIFITDMHGVVPEEEAYKGNVKLKEHFDAIEKKILQKSDLIITVTN
jgi:hypothetical protein